MNVRFLALACFALSGGCALPPPVAVPGPRTLAGERRLPVSDIAKQFTPAQWRKLSTLEYDAFVLFDAQIRPDGSLRLGRIRESYPDGSWQDLAHEFALEARLGAATVGTHIDPPAEVLVIFFKPGLDGNLALVVAKQKDDPAPGMTQKAIYIHARRH